MGYRYSEVGEQVYSDPEKAIVALKNAAVKYDGQVVSIAGSFNVNRTTLHRWVATLDEREGTDVRGFINSTRESAKVARCKAALLGLNDNVRSLLKASDGHIKIAAENASVSENTLYTWIRSLESAGFSVRSFARDLRDKREVWRMREGTRVAKRYDGPEDGA